MNTQATDKPAQAEMALTRHCPLVKCGQDVKGGERIATSNVPDKGDIHAPFPGKVLHVDPYRIRMAHAEGETVEPIPMNTVTGSELRDRLAEQGADLPSQTEVDILIINAVDAEPNVVSRRHLLTAHGDTLQTGAKALAEAYNPATTALAVPAGAQGKLNGMETTVISGHYPASLDPLVAKEVTGSEAPENTVVIGLETVFHVGRIMETGLPVMETMVTVGEVARIVPLGTSVGSIIDEAGEVILDRDRIILGGSMRGTAASSPNQGVDRDTVAVSVISNPSPVATDAACVGCGECVRRCPARLDPAMITSYAEFGLYADAAKEHVTACFECGLCGYFCIARRPMLQYIRLAKSELAKAEALSGEEK